jgi:predicted enzyme related to lactoylglutathione lyase
VKGRNPSLATKAGRGAGSTLPGLGWRLRRRWIPARARITSKVTMHMSSPRPVVHLELHTGDHARASAFYAKLLCWRQELIETGSGSYLALGLGGGFGGGIVEYGAVRPLRLPYVQVDQIEEFTERTRQLGASVLLAPREGPAGWRSVISAPQCGELAVWQPKP